MAKKGKGKKSHDRGNKGEWSEVYVFFHILGCHEIYPCNDQLEKRGNAYPVLEIIRSDSKVGEQRFIFNGKALKWNNHKNEVSIDPTKCSEEAEKLLHSIVVATGPSFVIPDSYSFLCSLGCGSIKADSAQKEDITLVIEDSRSGRTPACAFSIKSYLGSQPTLLNASKSCCFWYKVEGINNNKINEYNQMPPSKLIPQVYRDGGSFSYIEDSEDGQTFRENLEYIDSQMAKLVAELILYSHQYQLKKLDELVPKFADGSNPFKKNGEWYEYKIKKLLEAVALGMKPAKLWKGEEDANGGFIAVKPNGEVVTYHIYDRTELLNYLYHSTYLEHADMNKHDYGKIITNPLTQENSYKYVIQVRFEKYNG